MNGVYVCEFALLFVWVECFCRNYMFYFNSISSPMNSSLVYVHNICTYGHILLFSSDYWRIKCCGIRWLSYISVCIIVSRPQVMIPPSRNLKLFIRSLANGDTNFNCHNINIRFSNNNDFSLICRWVHQWRKRNDNFICRQWLACHYYLSKHKPAYTKPTYLRILQYNIVPLKSRFNVVTDFLSFPFHFSFILSFSVSWHSYTFTYAYLCSISSVW